MIKLTPAKRLKQLKQNGWLEFVEFMENAKISTRDLCYNPAFLKEFSRNKSFSWLAQDVERDLFKPDGGEHSLDSANYQMVGLAAQVSGSLPISNGSYSKPKNNKMVKKGKYE